MLVNLNSHLDLDKKSTNICNLRHTNTTKVHLSASQPRSVSEPICSEEQPLCTTIFSTSIATSRILPTMQTHCGIIYPFSTRAG
ncbi:hypothetical protein TcWFU_010312 [Taenia crassiceps]|uniref:Uncharacterized protein n=1 Tax=Taenia crassiceps TaxID=6207 RepID=A0ABR4QIE8_9CEST